MDPGNILRSWSGEDWQEYVCRLLRLKYEHDFVVIPDKDKGDMGLEGYTLTGLGFQCYAAQEPLRVAERYEKQRNKITRDVEKLRENKAKIESVLKSIQLRRWILIVPLFDSKEIVTHASNKSAEVKSWGLPFIAPDFHILIQSDDDYPIEQQKLSNAGLQRLKLSYDRAVGAVVTGWVGDHTPLVEKLTNKLHIAMQGKSEAEINTVRDQMIKLYIDGSNCLAAMKNDYPEHYEKAIEAKIAKEEVLPVQTALSNHPHSQTITKLLGVLETCFRADLPNLSSGEYELLAHECIADWLLRCPLNF